MSWKICDLVAKGSGPRVGVKDLIDVEGSKTSAGSRLVLSRAKPAQKDASLVASLKANGARIVAKTNLTEFAFGATGINPWFGTPTNPRNPSLIPGGSSSGSAVGLLTDELDVAIGSDTGGSIRIPSACCGVFGLKTTFGRIPIDGVWPLAPSLDTVGPMARTAENLELGMKLLEPDFQSHSADELKIGVISGSGVIEVLDVLAKLAQLGSSSVDIVADPGLNSAWEAGMRIMFYEALHTNAEYLLESHRLDPAMMRRFETAVTLNRNDLEDAFDKADVFKGNLEPLFAEFDVLALPTLKVPVPGFRDAYSVPLNANTIAFNAAGLPALSMPIEISKGIKNLVYPGDLFSPYGFQQDGDTPMPFSIEFVGRMNSEETLVGLAKKLEDAVNSI